MKMKVGQSTDPREDDYADFTDPSHAPFEQSLVPRATSKRAVRITGDPLSRLVLILLPFLMILAVLLNLAWKSIRPRVDGVVPLTGQVAQARIERAFIKPSVAGATSPQSQPAVGNNLVCALPLGWISHVVEPTESLFRLAVQYNVTPDQLQAANCMDNETTIMPGQVIFVPPLPAILPSPTPIPTATPTAVPTRVPYIPVAGENSSSGDSNNEPSQPIVPPAKPTAQPLPPSIAPTNPPPPQPTDPPPSVRPADPPQNKPAQGGGGKDDDDKKGKGGKGDGGKKVKDGKGKGKGGK